MIVSVAETANRVFCLHKACTEMGTMVAAVCTAHRLVQRVREVVEKLALNFCVFFMFVKCWFSRGPGRWKSLCTPSCSELLDCPMYGLQNKLN